MGLWSEARYDLGLTKQEFLSLTFREFHALRKRHKYRNQWNELLFAQVASLIGNTGFRSFEDPLEPKQFMPSQWGKQPLQMKAKEARPVTQQERAAVQDTFRTLFIDPTLKRPK